MTIDERVQSIKEYVYNDGYKLDPGQLVFIRGHIVEAIREYRLDRTSEKINAAVLEYDRLKRKHQVEDDDRISI